MAALSKVRFRRYRMVLAAGALGALSTAALAGECPADKVVADGMGQKMSTLPGKGVTDTVVGAIDLADEGPKIAAYKLRMRKLVIEPGGIVPWHSHGDRPAIIYTVAGSIVEYRSTCAVPIVHKAGDVALEVHTTSHWWQNTGKETVVLYVADILHDGSDPHQM